MHVQEHHTVCNADCRCRECIMHVLSIRGMHITVHCARAQYQVDAHYREGGT